MKIAVVVLALASIVYGDDAPYPSSGWKPQGVRLVLPKEGLSKYGPPTNEYGPPSNGHEPPSNGYGPPSNGYGPPTNEYRPPANGHEPPSNGYGPPSNGYGPPTNEYTPPANGHEPPSNGYGPPTNANGPPTNDSNSTTQAPQNETDLEKDNERLMTRLRLLEGSDRGVYYVHLPDGRLQRVQYTTAPIRKAPSANTQQSSFQNNQQSNTQFVFGAHQINTQGNEQILPHYQQLARLQVDSQNGKYAQQSEPSGIPSNLFAKYDVLNR